MPNDPAQPRRKHLRAQGFEYAEPGSYFVTICVDRMEHRFGRVQDGGIYLNDAGSLIRDAWSRIPNRFATVTLDLFVVMPNHIHGILLLDSGELERSRSLSRVIQAFKSESTVEYGRGVKAGRFPRYEGSLWQRSFHDKILRNDRMLDAARLYIEGNPGRWSENHQP